MKSKETGIVDFNSILAKRNTDYYFADTHNKPTLGKLKPDTILYTTRFSCPVVVGEIKTSKSLKSDHSKGQLIRYLEFIVSSQKFRAVVFGFLTDLKEFLFYRGERTKKSGMSFIEYPSGDVHLLTQMCLTSLATLGVTIPEVPGVEFSKFLGSGYSANVFECKISDQQVVAKVHFLPSTRIVEEKSLSSLAKCGADCVPKLIPNQKHHLILFVEPQGYHFRLGELKCEHILQLVRVLYTAHTQCRIVHRDVSFRNILCVGEDVLLNDWASAVPCGEEQTYVGVRVEASDEILQHLLEKKYLIVARPSDDLHALARAVHICFVAKNQFPRP